MELRMQFLEFHVNAFIEARGQRLDALELTLGEPAWIALGAESYDNVPAEIRFASFSLAAE